MSESSFVMEDNWRQRKSLMLIRKRAYLENCVSPAQMLLRCLFKPPENGIEMLATQVLLGAREIHFETFEYIRLCYLQESVIVLSHRSFRIFPTRSVQIYARKRHDNLYCFPDKLKDELE